MERSPQRKRVAPKRARRRAEPRRPQRRDSSNQQVTARPFHRRTQTSEASKALKRNDENLKRISSFLFILMEQGASKSIPSARSGWVSLCNLLDSSSAHCQLRAGPTRYRDCVKVSRVGKDTNMIATPIQYRERSDRMPALDNHKNS